jgi:hypothetical protein
VVVIIITTALPILRDTLGRRTSLCLRRNCALLTGLLLRLPLLQKRLGDECVVLRWDLSG